MADIQRKSSAVWQGDLRGGKGQFSSGSGVLNQIPYSFATRFENAQGTNPEELIAAAHASCFSMAFANTLAGKGFTPDRIETQAILSMDRDAAGFSVTKIRLETQGKVANIDEQTFQSIAEDAKKNCPISRLLSPGLKEIELVATLVK